MEKIDGPLQMNPKDVVNLRNDRKDSNASPKETHARILVHQRNFSQKGVHLKKHELWGLDMDRVMMWVTEDKLTVFIPHKIICRFEHPDHLIESDFMDHIVRCAAFLSCKNILIQSDNEWFICDVNVTLKRGTIRVFSTGWSTFGRITVYKEESEENAQN